MRMGASNLQIKHLIGTSAVTLRGDKAVVETNAMIVGENARPQLGCSVHNRFLDLAQRRKARRPLAVAQARERLRHGHVHVLAGLRRQRPCHRQAPSARYAPLAYVLEKSGVPVGRVFATRGSAFEKTMKADTAAWLAS